MEKWKLLAKLKILRNIASSYISLWAYLMIILMYFNINVEDVYMIMFFMVSVVLTLVDYLWIFPKEQQITWEKNPAYRKLEEKNERQL